MGSVTGNLLFGIRAVRAIGVDKTNQFQYSTNWLNIGIGSCSMLAIDKAMNALADPTRREIISQLSVGERRVGDIAEPHSMSLNAVSKHIKVLEDAGLVVRRKDGRTHYLSFNPAGLEPASDWIEQTRALWSKRLDALEAALLADDANQEKRGKK